MCVLVLCCTVLTKNPPISISHYSVGVSIRKSCQALQIYNTELYGIQWASSASPDSCPNSAQLSRPRVEISSFCLHHQTEKHTALDKADLFSPAQTSRMLQGTVQNVHAHIAQSVFILSLYETVGVCVCVDGWEMISAKIGKATGITEMI